MDGEQNGTQAQQVEQQQENQASQQQANQQEAQGKHALKAAEPWMFADAPQKQTGKTGLPNAGTATDEGKQLKRWEKLAGLSDDDE